MACKFCFFLNGYVVKEPEDCVGCGRCYGVWVSKEDIENDNKSVV